MCGDGTGVEVEGQLCENAERGYHGEKQSWLYSVCVGAAWVSARLHAGSVTDPRQKARILRLAAARGLREDEGEPLDAAGKERAVAWCTGRPGGRRSRCTG